MSSLKLEAEITFALELIVLYFDLSAGYAEDQAAAKAEAAKLENKLARKPK